MNSTSLLLLALLLTTAGFSCAEGDALTQPGAVTDAGVAPSAADARVERDAEASVDAAQPCDGCSVPSPITAVALPLDARYNLFGVWGTRREDVWAVGAAGAAVHFDGSAWTSFTTGTTQALNAVWGRSASDVLAVSNAGLVLRYEGATGWQLDPPLDDLKRWRALSVWGVAGDLYVVGSGLGDFGQNVMAQQRQAPFGSGTWQERGGCVNCPVATGIWGSSASDLWLVGERGQAQHSVAFDADGAPLWTPVQTFASRTLTALWGLGANDVWAVGEVGTIRHWRNDASQRWDVVASPTTANLRAVWGSSASDVWAVGDGATVLHFDGVRWSLLDSGLTDVAAESPLYGVWGSGPDDVWMVGTGVVLHAAKGTPP